MESRLGEGLREVEVGSGTVVSHTCRRVELLLQPIFYVYVVYSRSSINTPIV